MPGPSAFRAFRANPGQRAVLAPLDRLDPLAPRALRGLTATAEPLARTGLPGPLELPELKARRELRASPGHKASRAVRG